MLLQNLCFGQYTFSLEKYNSGIKILDFEIVDVKFETKNNYFGDVFVANLKKEKIGLKENIEKSIFQYYKKYNSNKNAKVKVMILVKNLMLVENSNASKNIDGKISYDFEAYFVNEKDSSKFCNSRNSAKYTRTSQTSMLPNVEKQFISVLDGGLNFIIKYVSNSKSKMEAFATHSKVIIKPLYSKPSVDTVYYQQRKVNWNDFQGPFRASEKYGAAIFSSFGYDSKIYVENYTIYTEITPKVFTDKNMSWAKPEVKNSYSLNHEQLHFDICFLNSLRFLKKIKTFDKEPTQDDLISRIKYEYLEFYRATHNMQEQYDSETNHSIIKDKQIAWQIKIEEALKEIKKEAIFEN
ncbi:hypothetical protein [Lacihabitans sp. LS3-19]|uniref:hypothetical protein n=1 Tax=Lacihabitans sp. LS3-19 TaxID=2487335 RepID=UPI0020CF61C1|nr:hypothetical protein [Lacihabitans sp. LS3-19]